METVKIRLEACSVSMAKNENVVLAQTRVQHNSWNLQAVVGRAITEVRADQSAVLQNMNIGDRLCCQLDIPVPPNGAFPQEIDVLPHAAFKIPAEMDASECAAILNPCIRIYTALHVLAHAELWHSILIACPNDLNFTCLAMQVCNLLKLKAFALVPDDHALTIASQFTDSKKLIKLDGMDAKSLVRTCELKTNYIGFNCILDFKNNEDASSHLPLPFNMFIRHMLHVAFGRIVTDRQEQISAADAKVLLMKSGSIHYFMDQIWHLAPLDYGKYRHMLADIVSNLKDGKLRPIVNLKLNPSQIEELSEQHDEKQGCTVIHW